MSIGGTLGQPGPFSEGWGSKKDPALRTIAVGKFRLSVKRKAPLHGLLLIICVSTALLTARFTEHQSSHSPIVTDIAALEAFVPQPATVKSSANSISVDYLRAVAVPATVDTLKEIADRSLPEFDSQTVLKGVIANWEKIYIRAAAAHGSRLEAVLSTATDSPAVEQGETQATVAATVSPTETVTIASLGTPTPVPPAPIRREPFFTYTVQPGDTLASIASRHGVSLESLLWNNSELRDDPDYLSPGDELLITREDGFVYTLRLGDTLGDIAERYGITVESILKANDLSDPDMVPEGALVLLPGATPPPPQPTPAPALASPSTPVATAAPAISTPLPETATPAPAPAAAATSSGSLFIWPATGSISDYFGAPRGAGTYHMGLDIDSGTVPVRAAAAGRVVYVAYQSYGYGNHIIIDHGDGWETLYAHLSRVDVAIGQYVGQGEVIGVTGSTGYSTGVHLHFEIHRYGQYLDPLDYLP